MVTKRVRGYITREGSNQLAKTLKLNSNTAYVLVGLYNKETGKARAELFTQRDVDRFPRIEYYKHTHLVILAESIYIGKRTQKEMADIIYQLCHNGQLQKVKQELTHTSNAKFTQELKELHQVPYPVKTNKGIYIGDPMSVIPDSQWDEFVNRYRKAREAGYNHFNFNGYTVGVVSVEARTGVFYDEDEIRYVVDSGLIGATPLELVKAFKGANGYILEGKQQARVRSYEGRVFINTGEQTVTINTSHARNY